MTDDKKNARKNVLEIKSLQVSAHINGADYLSLDIPSLTIQYGEARGLVGESGSGKSLTLKAIMGLLPSNMTVTGGSIWYDGQDILANGGSLVRTIRGSGIAMVFQEPAVALNPVMRVGRQIVDGLARRKGLNRADSRRYAIELMNEVGIHEPERWVNAYPHQLSGGMRQRVMIASAIACEPRIILCDEPTTALDVTVQAQILKLFKKLQQDSHLSMLYVTHDLGVVSEFCDSLSVMYAGSIVEQSDDLATMVRKPAHPYTQALLAAVPSIRGPVQRLKGLASNAPPLALRKQDPKPDLVEIAPGWEMAPVSNDDARLFRVEDEYGAL